MSHLLLLSLSFALQSAPFWCSSFLVTLVLELLLTFASLLIQFIDKSYWFHFQNPLILVSHTPFTTTIDVKKLFFAWTWTVA